MAGHVEYCTTQKPPHGYRIWRSERGRHFWVTGDADPPEKFRNAVVVCICDQTKTVPKDKNPMDRIKRIFDDVEVSDGKSS